MSSQEQKTVAPSLRATEIAYLCGIYAVGFREVLKAEFGCLIATFRLNSEKRRGGEEEEEEEARRLGYALGIVLSGLRSSGHIHHAVPADDTRAGLRLHGTVAR